MFDGKMKAFTLSYDDGITQDKRLISILDKYGLKCTFNLNSLTFGNVSASVKDGSTVPHVIPRACEIRKIYEGHEIAGHTLTHPRLMNLSDEDVIREVEQDRLNLSKIAGYEVVGMAYPFGTANIDERVIKLVRENTGVKYARTTTLTHDFEPQKDLITFDTTIYHRSFDELFELAEKFIALRPTEPKIFSIWGHSYEFDIANEWGRFEEFCKLISGHDDIFYGTNREVLLGMPAPSEE